MNDKAILIREDSVDADAVAERIPFPDLRISDIQGQVLKAPSTPVANTQPGNDRNSLHREPNGAALIERGPFMHHGRSFELVSFATPARWGSLRDGADHELFDRGFQSEIHVALMPFVEHLPIGAGLVVDYELLPTGNGAVKLRTSIWADVTATGEEDASLDGELQTCLSALSDHFTFRISDIGQTSGRAKDGQSWRVRPLGIDLRPKAAAGIGFAARPDDAPRVFRFPAIDIARSAIGQGRQAAWQPWSAALHHAFKAARGSGHALRIRIRLTRERLSEDAISALRRMNVEDLEHVAGKGQPGNGSCLVSPPYSPNMINALVSGWSAVAADALRIDLEAEAQDGRVSATLLRILSTELFPGLPVEIRPPARTEGNLNSSAILDLSNLYPLAAGLPPLLPHPGLLASVDFPRHYNNPSFGLPTEGLLLGHAAVNGLEREVRITDSALARHSYIVGTTGCGKSTFAMSSIRQHLDAGDGVGVVEPHGDLADSVLEHVPNHRLDDVVYIDPSDSDYPVGLNPLDLGDRPDPIKVHRLINDLMDIFEEIYDLRLTGGPGFEMFFRYTMFLASTAPHDLKSFPKGPPTLLTAVAVLSDDDLREYLLGKVCSSFLGEDLGRDIIRFFESAQKQSGDQSFKNWVIYVSSKLTRFLSNTRIRKLLCSPKRTVDFRRLMDERKILVVKLSKGELGDQDTKLIGRLVTKFIYQAALSRSDQPQEERVPFFYFLDEFQNFVCRDVSQMLAESRKYALCVSLIHQNISQLDENGSRSMLSSILGNCSNRFAFRVGLEDAKILEPAFLPHFDARVMCELADRKVLARIVTGNRPSPPFIFETLTARPPSEMIGAESRSVLARDLSRKKYSTIEHSLEVATADPSGGSLFKTLFEDGAKDGGAYASREPTLGLQGQTMTLLDDLIAIKPGTVKNDRAYFDLRAASEQAPVRWRGNMSSDSQTIQPEAGRFYWTTNRSLVMICSVADDDARGVVISGGHGEQLLNGTRPGESVRIGPTGKLQSPGKLRSLLGLDLVALAKITFADTEIFDTAIDESGSWLISPAHRLQEVVTGFYLTHNKSIVFVAHSSESSALSRATVCRGGHGIGTLVGEKPFESYCLSSIGQYEINGEKAIEIPTTDLGQIAGMSLARLLPLIGLDVPEALIATSPKKPPRTRKGPVAILPH